jgi:hypothetical protein
MTKLPTHFKLGHKSYFKTIPPPQCLAISPLDAFSNSSEVLNTVAHSRVTKCDNFFVLFDNKSNRTNESPNVQNFLLFSHKLTYRTPLMSTKLKFVQTNQLIGYIPDLHVVIACRYFSIFFFT